ncbi:DnaT-like ssDNA-binding protein [Mesorhizobium amorphae]|uniref:DnaT-like ssDNA-binding protein n=1 Tax=Mesorhizobium amorphae TaxID=71433 RepID=UPI0011837988|nr:DnaT-like ssDNA-binding protein [Mesorhizobium amorphae]
MAEIYGTLAAATTYHADRGNDAWAAPGVTDAKRTAALVRASSSLDGQYGAQFPGTKTGGRTQVLAWPRKGARDHCADEAIPDTEIPQAVINAAYELALAELLKPGDSSPTVTPGRVVKRQKVDTIEREFFSAAEGASTSLDAMRPVLLAVEDALRCILVPTSASVDLLRT